MKVSGYLDLVFNEPQCLSCRRPIQPQRKVAPGTCQVGNEIAQAMRDHLLATLRRGFQGQWVPVPDGGRFSIYVK